jgi:DHA1 family bicyclomycin/chloramphenicol resistance-like MFS transporter
MSSRAGEVQCLVAIHFQLGESHDIQHEPPLQLKVVARNYLDLFESKSFVGYTLSGGLAIAGMFAYVAGSPFVVTTLYGVSSAHFGWVFGLNAIGLIGASQINARQLKKYAPETLLRGALWLKAFCGLALLAMELGFRHHELPPFAFVIAGLFFYVASIGYVSPNAAALALAEHGEHAGTASALMGALQFGLGTLAGIALGLLHDETALPLAMVLAVCGTGAWLSYYLLVHSTPHKLQD